MISAIFFRDVSLNDEQPLSFSYFFALVKSTQWCIIHLLLINLLEEMRTGPIFHAPCFSCNLPCLLVCCGCCDWQLLECMYIQDSQEGIYCQRSFSLYYLWRKDKEKGSCSHNQLFCSTRKVQILQGSFFHTLCFG